MSPSNIKAPFFAWFCTNTEHRVWKTLNLNGQERQTETETNDDWGREKEDQLVCPQVERPKAIGSSIGSKISCGFNLKHDVRVWDLLVFSL